MSSGSNSSTSGMSGFGKRAFALIGGLSAIVLAVGLVGEFGARRVAAPAVVTEKTAAARVETPPPRIEPAPGSAPAQASMPASPPPAPAAAPAPASSPAAVPIRTARETVSRSAANRPLAIGGPPRPDQFKPAEPGPASSSATESAAGPKAPVDAPAAAAPAAADGSRKVRVIAIERQPDEAAKEAAASAPAGAPSAAEEPIATAQAAPPSTPAITQAEISAPAKANAAPDRLSDESGSPSAVPAAGIQAEPPKRQAEFPPLPPPAPPVRTANVEEPSQAMVGAPSATRVARPEPEDVLPMPRRAARPEREQDLPVNRPASRPPFRPDPVTAVQNARRTAAVAAPATTAAPAVAPIPRIPTERIPNLDQAYRRMQAESQAAVQRPVRRQSRVALGQPRHPTPSAKAERQPPSPRLVVMHMRTYRAPDGELFDVLYRRPPATDRQRFSASGAGPSRGGVMDWVNR